MSSKGVGPLNLLVRCAYSQELLCANANHDCMALKIKKNDVMLSMSNEKISLKSCYGEDRILVNER